MSKKIILRRVLADVTNDAVAIKPEFDDATGREQDKLRCHVKSLLQKVETDLHRAPSLRALSHINGFLSSPSRLAPPTPWKTPAATFTSARRIPFQDEPLPVYIDRTVPSTSKTDTQIAFNIESTATPFHDAHLALASPAMLTPVSSLSNLTNTVTPSPGREGHGRGREEVMYADDEDKDSTDNVRENPVTRALLFGTPENHSPVEISMSSFSAAALSEISPTKRESRGDESSDWSVLVAFSPSDRVRLDGQARRHRANGDSKSIELYPTSVESCKQNEAQAATRKARRHRANEDSKSIELHPTSVESCKQNEAVDEKAWGINSTPRKYQTGGDAVEYDFEVDDSESIHHYAESTEEDDNYRHLCTELEGMTVGEKQGLPEFKGKRTCFIYNSDDEIEEELVVSTAARNTSPTVLHLRGLPTPKGKHLRFPDEDFE